MSEQMQIENVVETIELTIKPSDVNLGGRPAKYSPKINARVYKLTLLGLTDIQLAGTLEIDISTFYKWKVDHPKFSEAINKAKEDADAKVANSLYRRALGYERKQKVGEFVDEETGARHTTYKVEHVPADTKAAMFWLKNRQPKIWRDKTETEHSLAPVEFVNDVPRPDEQ